MGAHQGAQGANEDAARDGVARPIPRRVAAGRQEVGAALEFPNVLAVFKDGEALTESQLAHAKVLATITANDRSKKVLVFKFKRKKQYKRTIGHRQHFTELRVNEIVA